MPKDIIFPKGEGIDIQIYAPIASEMSKDCLYVRVGCTQN